MSSIEPRPWLPIAADGIYPRCVWCLGENYLPAVLGYSRRQHACAAVRSCGRMLPEEYVKEEDHGEGQE